MERPGELTTMYNIVHLRKCIPKCKQMLTKLLEYNPFESDRLKKDVINFSRLRLPVLNYQRAFKFKLFPGHHTKRF